MWENSGEQKILANFMNSGQFAKVFSINTYENNQKFKSK